MHVSLKEEFRVHIIRKKLDLEEGDNHNKIEWLVNKIFDRKDILTYLIIKDNFSLYILNKFLLAYAFN